MKKLCFFLRVVCCWGVALLITAGIAAAGQEYSAGQRQAATAGALPEWEYRNIKVIEVLEGDTLRLETGELLRLIGVDTPENQKSAKRYGDAKITGIPEEVLDAMAKEALQFTRSFVQDLYVSIEFDTQAKDQYGMLLGYVFVPERDIQLNAEIMKKGYTWQVDTGANKRYNTLFNTLLGETKQHSQGIWRQWQR
jgi:micrococcal nuclease